jgi:dihydroflavonol-4-reductase
LKETAVRVLVTGANGHLGFALVKHLLTRGHAVRASVRSLADRAKAAPLTALAGVELVEADVYARDQLRDAVRGIDVLFHAAAVFKLVATAAEGHDMVRSSVEGTENVLRAAAAAGVPKVVMTSSIYALPLATRDGPAVTEDKWAQDLRVPYIRAKTQAEHSAWQLARELKLDLVTLLPGAIAGPGFRRNTPSIDTIECLMRGYFRWCIPDMNLPYVDVRDVAAAHSLAGETKCSGRFIVCNDVAPSFAEIIEIMRRIDRSVPAPLMRVPDFMLAAGPLFDRLNHRLLGTPRIAGRELTATITGRRYTFSNSRLKRDLGWRQSVRLETSLADTMAQIRENRREFRPERSGSGGQ